MGWDGKNTGYSNEDYIYLGRILEGGKAADWDGNGVL
jgi:hypothetical protein